VKSLFIENVLDLKTGWTRVGKSGLSNCMLTLLEWLRVGLGVQSSYIDVEFNLRFKAGGVLDECETFFLLQKRLCISNVDLLRVSIYIENWHI